MTEAVVALGRIQGRSYRYSFAVPQGIDFGGT
jgi:hypothetical protein